MESRHVKTIRQRLNPVCHLVMSVPRGWFFAPEDSVAMLLLVESMATFETEIPAAPWEEVGLLVVRTGRRWKLWRERALVSDDVSL